MIERDDFEDTSTLSPDEAFAVLGDETRLEILRTLGVSDGPLSFSELFTRVDYETTANFSYHLQKVVGHFIRKTEEGYVLQQAGRRVIESVLSGAVTEAPVIERTPAGKACPFCGEEIDVRYEQGDLILYCGNCGGTRDGASQTARWAEPDETDILGHVSVPPAGVHDRSLTELVVALVERSLSPIISVFDWMTRGIDERISGELDIERPYAESSGESARIHPVDRQPDAEKQPDVRNLRSTISAGESGATPSTRRNRNSRGS